MAGKDARGSTFLKFTTAAVVQQGGGLLHRLGRLRFDCVDGRACDQQQTPLHIPLLSLVSGIYKGVNAR